MIKELIMSSKSSLFLSITNFLMSTAMIKFSNIAMAVYFLMLFCITGFVYWSYERLPEVKYAFKRKNVK